MKDELSTLVLDLCKIDSTTGQEKGAVDFLEGYLKRKGWHTERQKVGPEEGRDNLWVFSSGAAPSVFYCTHLQILFLPLLLPNYLMMERCFLAEGFVMPRGLQPA